MSTNYEALFYEIISILLLFHLSLSQIYFSGHACLAFSISAFVSISEIKFYTGVLTEARTTLISVHTFEHETTFHTQKLCRLLISIPYLHRCKSVRTRPWWERHSRRQRRRPPWPRARNVRRSGRGHSRGQSSGGRASEHGWHRRHWHWRHWRTQEPSRWHRWRRGCVGWSWAKRHRWRGWWHSTPAHSVRGLWGWLLARHNCCRDCCCCCCTAAKWRLRRVNPRVSAVRQTLLARSHYCPAPDGSRWYWNMDSSWQMAQKQRK